MTALDGVHISLAPAAFLSFVWEMKLPVGKVSGPATCHWELDESGWARELLGIYHEGPELGRSPMPLSSGVR